MSSAISLRFKLIQDEREFVVDTEEGKSFVFFSLNLTREHPKESKRKRPAVGMEHMFFLFQDANKFRERSYGKTVSRLAKLNKGYCLYIQIYLCQGKAGNFSSNIGSFRNNL